MAWEDRRGERISPRKILISSLGGKCEKCGTVADLEIHHRIPLAAGSIVGFRQEVAKET